MKLPLERFDEISRRTPRRGDLRPTGRFLMEDFYFAGGLRALLAQLLDQLHGDALTVTGQTLRDNLAGAEIYNADECCTSRRKAPSAARSRWRFWKKELTARRAAWTQAPRPVQRGYLSLFLNEVTPADEGCDFRFLEGTAPTPEPAIH